MGAIWATEQVGDGEYRWRVGERSGVLSVPGLGGGLAILPDERLAGIVERDGATELWIMSLGGSVERTLASPRGFDFYFFPDWRTEPDVVVCSLAAPGRAAHRDWRFRFDADTGLLQKLGPVEVD